MQWIIRAFLQMPTAALSKSNQSKISCLKTKTTGLERGDEAKMLGRAEQNGRVT